MNGRASKAWMAAARMTGAVAMLACGPTASSVREQELLAPGAWGTRLADGRLHQEVNAYVPVEADPASCSLRVSWRTPSAEGVVDALAPTSVSGRHATWSLLVEVGDGDVARVESEVTCGALRASVNAQHAATEASRTRYCGLCPDRTAHAPTPPREWGRAGVRLAERPGVAARIDGPTVVDECTGRVLLDVRDLEVRLGGGADSEAEAELLLRAERGEPVCDSPFAGSHITIVGGDSDLAQAAQRLANVPELDVELSLEPLPG